MKAPSAPSPLTIEQIAARAREIWQRIGCPPGRDLDYWLQAENELVFEREQAAHAAEETNRAADFSPPRDRPAGQNASSKTPATGRRDG